MPTTPTSHLHWSTALPGTSQANSPSEIDQLRHPQSASAMPSAGNGNRPILHTADVAAPPRRRGRYYLQNKSGHKERRTADMTFYRTAKESDCVATYYRAAHTEATRSRHRSYQQQQHPRNYHTGVRTYPLKPPSPSNTGAP